MGKRQISNNFQSKNITNYYKFLVKNRKVINSNKDKNRMDEKNFLNSSSPSSTNPNLFFIPPTDQSKDQQFQILNHQVNNQQQQIDSKTPQIYQIEDLLITNPSQKEAPLISQLEFQKQFQEIRFGSNECNLIDLDLKNETIKKTVSEMSRHQYEQFIHNRIIEIEAPQLITEGLILSYKLYQIKTKVLKIQNKGLSSERQQNLEKKEISFASTTIFCSGLQSQQNKLLSSIEQDNTCVSRRFSDFQYLNELLISNYGGFVIPLLPQKNFWTVVNLEGKEYAEIRTKSLLKYLNRIFTHKTLKHCQEVKHFLFQQDSSFSIKKGEYLQKNKRIEDRVISIGFEAILYGKALYNRLIGTADKNKNDEEIRLSKNKLTKQDLVFSEYQIIVAQLMRIILDLKDLVKNTVQQIQTLQDISVLFSASLTDSFNIQNSLEQSGHEALSSNLREQIIKDQKQKINAREILDQFEEICQFIQSCYAAIQRRKNLHQQMQSLKAQQENLAQKYKNSPRSLELDIIRSKLQKLNKMNETYAKELLKELQIHIDEGKGMLRIFVQKFQNLRKEFFLNVN